MMRCKGKYKQILEISISDKCLWSTLVIGDFPGGSVVKNLPASAEDGDSIPGSERSSLKFEEMATHVSIFA